MLQKTQFLTEIAMHFLIQKALDPQINTVIVLPGSLCE